MPATQAKSGFNTKLARGDGGSPEAFTVLAEVKDINGPDLAQATEDATHMESPDGYDEFIATTRSGGSVTFQAHLLESENSQSLLMADFNSGTKRNWRIGLPSGLKRFAFAAIVENISHAFPVKGVMVRNVTLKVSGKPVFENGTATGA